METNAGSTNKSINDIESISSQVSSSSFDSLIESTDTQIDVDIKPAQYGQNCIIIEHQQAISNHKSEYSSSISNIPVIKNNHLQLSPSSEYDDLLTSPVLAANKSSIDKQNQYFLGNKTPKKQPTGAHRNIASVENVNLFSVGTLITSKQTLTTLSTNVNNVASSDNSNLCSPIIQNKNINVHVVGKIVENKNDCKFTTMYDDKLCSPIIERKCDIGSKIINNKSNSYDKYENLLSSPVIGCKNKFIADVKILCVPENQLFSTSQSNLTYNRDVADNISLKSKNIVVKDKKIIKKFNANKWLTSCSELDEPYEENVLETGVSQEILEANMTNTCCVVRENGINAIRNADQLEMVDQVSVATETNLQTHFDENTSNRLADDIDSNIKLDCSHYGRDVYSILKRNYKSVGLCLENKMNTENVKVLNTSTCNELNDRFRDADSNTKCHENLNRNRNIQPKSVIKWLRKINNSSLKNLRSMQNKTNKNNHQLIPKGIKSFNNRNNEGTKRFSIDILNETTDVLKSNQCAEHFEPTTNNVHSISGGSKPSTIELEKTMNSNIWIKLKSDNKHNLVKDVVHEVPSPSKSICEIEYLPSQEDTIKCNASRTVNTYVSHDMNFLHAEIVEGDTVHDLHMIEELKPNIRSSNTKTNALVTNGCSLLNHSSKCSHYIWLADEESTVSSNKNGSYKFYCSTSIKTSDELDVSKRLRNHFSSKIGTSEASASSCKLKNSPSLKLKPSNNVSATTSSSHTATISSNSSSSSSSSTTISSNWCSELRELKRKRRGSKRNRLESQARAAIMKQRSELDIWKHELYLRTERKVAMVCNVESNQARTFITIAIRTEFGATMVGCRRNDINCMLLLRDEFSNVKAGVELQLMPPFFTKLLTCEGVEYEFYYNVNKVQLLLK